ncbi:MAG: hypothetical protein DCC68_09190 [Planctomycetota bacterium]|nr:MAG: hypothetical protein DCC68_09190 [Planctomycetota bacterium]
MPDEPSKSKLFIDEDWKSQVQAEKEAAKQAATPKPAETAAPTGEAAAGESAHGGEMPPPSLASLVISLATQAMGAMGLLAGPDGQPLPAEPAYAKYLIDTIAMLEAKTAGNRTAEETAMFDDALYQLRMAFVSINRPA